PSQSVTPPSRRRSFASARWLLGGLLVLVVAFLDARRPLTPPKTSAATRPRIVVLPFENRTGDSTQDIVGLMAADFTSIALWHSALLDVSGPSFDFWNPENARPSHRPRIETLVKQTGATMVVSGAYYRVGDSLAFTGEATD